MFLSSTEVRPLLQQSKEKGDDRHLKLWKRMGAPVCSSEGTSHGKAGYVGEKFRFRRLRSLCLLRCRLRHGPSAPALSFSSLRTGRGRLRLPLSPVRCWALSSD